MAQAPSSTPANVLAAGLPSSSQVPVCGARMDAVNLAWQTALGDTNKLDAMVTGVANCLAKVLHIKDGELGVGAPSLGRALYEEKESFPTREQLDEVERIYNAERFVKQAHCVAHNLRREADARTNVLLTRFSALEPYCKSWKFQRARGECTSTLRVGGLRRALFRDVLDLVTQWLLKCDAAMMIAFEDVTHERADEERFMDLVKDYAFWITSRLTLMPDEADQHLSTDSLQSRAAKELASGSVVAEESHRSDLAALNCLETLAREGPRSERGKAILTTQLDLLKYVLSKPPSELGLQGIDTQHMNLALLRRACDPEVDVQVRADMVQQWQQWHGACTVCAATQAAQKLRLWAGKSSWIQPFIKVLYTPEEKAPAGAVEMPRTSFVHSAHVWKFVPPASSQRTVFDWCSRRCVRLTSLVLQLVGHGGLERGVVGSAVVGPIATQAVLEAAVVLELLDMKREAYAAGTKLLFMCNNVYDRQSHVAALVDQALLHLSRFSLMELTVVFSQQSPALRAVLSELTYRTRIAIGNYQTAPVVPRSYVAFAYDTIAILLPVVRARRECASLTPMQSTNPLCELLRMVPRVRAWSPLQGTLNMELSEVNQQPPLFKQVLQQLAARGLLVKWKRPYLGAQRHAAKMSYVFDTPQLVAALSGYRLCAPLGARQGAHGRRSSEVHSHAQDRQARD